MAARRYLPPKWFSAGPSEHYAVLLFYPNRIARDALNRPQTALPSALVAEYLQRCRSDLAQLKQVLAAGEYETARRLGHQMKGTGKPYGFPELTQIGRAIEWAASKRAAPELNSRIQRLEICLSGIELASERED